VVPDAEVAWRDVWIGAAATALIFVVGKLGIGLYLGRGNVGSSYGAAGTLLVLLVWVYYSTQILFLGAEFTQVYAERYGSAPLSGAQRFGESSARAGAARSASSPKGRRGAPDGAGTAPASDHGMNKSRKRGSRHATSSKRRSPSRPRRRRERAAKVRYAVVGAGHIVQVAVLPAFRNARRNSELAAIVSGDATKRDELGIGYEVPAYDYAAFEECLEAERIDAVYIGLPNDQHAEFTERAAAAGVHVLCEKPMAVTTVECDRMLRATQGAGVKLMIAYRLHFEAANLQAIQVAASGALGTPRLFVSEFSMQVRADDIRTSAAKGGGPLYDIGIYCIQAARYLFRCEPTQVLALAARGDDPRFAEVNEAVGCILRFPDERLAAFTCSFGAADVSSYRLVGARGDLRVEPAYDYTETLIHHQTVDGRTRTRRYPRRDQFAPELLHFSACILEGREPEPSGREGKVDVQIIEALHRSVEQGAAIDLPRLQGDRPPQPRQGKRLPRVRKPRLVHVESTGR